MRIEFGFQANCSELITHLGFTEKADIIQAMGAIEDFTGWTWRVQVGSRFPREISRGEIKNHSCYILVPTGVLESLIEFHEKPSGYRGFVINTKELILQFESIPPDVEKELIDMSKPREQNILWIERNPCLMNIPAAHPVFFTNKWMNSVNSSISCDCGTFDFACWIGNHDADMFPAFHKIRRKFLNTFHTHGCGDCYYLEWMGYHFMNKDRVEEYMRWFRKNDKRKEDEIQFDIEFIAKNPPLPDSGKLNDDEINEINYSLSDMFDDIEYVEKD